jgi:hypothetical protein
MYFLFGLRVILILVLLSILYNIYKKINKDGTDE